MLNQYQRRADLIPNIVATVKGEANFEQETLTKVIEARSRATSIQATPELINNPEAFDKFQKAQGELTGALSRLMVVAEQYPQLRANQAFQDLRVQLEGTENRITVARNRYIKTVADYNVLARSFPSNLTAMVFGYKRQAELHGAERSADFGAAGGELRQAGLQVSQAIAGLDAFDALMRWLARCSSAAALGLLGGLVATAQDVLPVPPLSGRVIDQTATLTPAQVAAFRPSSRRSRPSAARRSSC